VAEQADKKRFQFFPEDRAQLEYPWPVWAMGLLAVFKSVLWIAYGTRYGWQIPDLVMELMLYRFVIFTIPFFVLGAGVWNMRPWAVRYLPILAAIDLLISLAMLGFYPQFYFFSSDMGYQSMFFTAVAAAAGLIVSFRDVIIDVLILALTIPVIKLANKEK
jgi:hypothetical protein